MRDIALVWNGALGEADIALAGSDLLTDDGLQTAVIVSLFTDAPADPGDAIPDGTTDRRGWWGDMPVDAAAQTGTPDVTGSKLWLLDRAVLNAETLARAESYALAALAWMKRDGVAGNVTARATSPQRGWLELAIDIFQAGSRRQFSLAWAAVAAAGAPAPVAVVPAGIVLRSDSGAAIVSDSGTGIVIA